MADMESHQLSS